MSSSNSAYERLQARSFQQAIVQLLETEYKLVGSHRVIHMMADDIDQLHREYYPEEHQRDAGEIVWRTTSREQTKPERGDTLQDHRTTTVRLPLMTEEDIESKKKGISSVAHDKIRIKRLAEAAYEQGGMLNESELAALMNRSQPTISRRIQEIQQEETTVLPLKGTLLDMGRGTSHKGVILQLYEQKVAPPDIARQTYHDLSSVDRYIKDYERIKLLMRKGLSPEEIRQATGKSKTLVKEYQGIIEEYYDDLKVNEGDTTHEKTQQMEFVDEKQSKERNNGEK